MMLSDLCDLVVDQVHPSDCEGQCVYLGLEHLAPGRMTPIASGVAADVNSHKYRFRQGDVLYGKLRPYLDKAVLAEIDGVCTTELLVLRPKDGVHPKFLSCVLHAPDFIEHAISGITGAHHPRTSWTHISQFSFPAFDRVAQTATATLLWRVHDLIVEVAKAEEAATEIKRAAMRDLFTQGLRGEPQKETEIGPVPESWDVVSIGALFTITQGISLKRNLSEGMDGIPFLRTSNVYWGHVDLGSMSRMHIDQALVGDRWLLPGDLLVCEGGEIGRCAVWRGELNLCTYQNHLHRLRPATADRIDPAFAAAWLEVGFLQRGIYEGAGNKTTIPNLSRTRLAELRLPVPTIDEQRDIVAILDAIDRKIALHRQKKAVLEELFKALLHKLMTGEIRVADLDLSALESHPAPYQAA